MKLVLIVAHPNPTSINHAIAVTCSETLVAKGHEVVFHDLHAEHYDPILPLDELSRDAVVPLEIHRHCEEVSQADGIIVVHPNWWGQPPAILKGWVDRVIRPGVAYAFVEGDTGEGVPRGLLKASTAGERKRWLSVAAAAVHHFFPENQRDFSRQPACCAGD